MYINEDRKIIHDREAYTDALGTNYPANFPKDKIVGLTKVYTTPVPADKVVDGYIIDNDNVQVWKFRDKTDEEIAREKAIRVSDLRQAAYASEGEQLDMIYWDLMHNSNLFKDHRTSVKLLYRKD